MAFEIPGPLKLVVAVGGIFFSFSYFALLQEDLFKKPYGGERFKSTFFMMVAERGVNAVVALVFLLVRFLANFLRFASHMRSAVSYFNLFIVASNYCRYLAALD